ncbi:MAG: glycosyltransferase [Muribaculaceae bacterium]|nr:glycosyltransferase [Muribaculaceae bacterium]
MKKLSIITITYNDGDTFRKAVESVDAQTARPEIEHIVVDSSNVPVALPPESDARLVRTEPRGVYASLNEGIRQSTCDVIGMVHGNDWLPDADVARKVIEAFDADPELDFIFGDVEYRNLKTGRLLRSYSAARFRPQLLDYGFTPGHPTLYVRRRVFDLVGLYDESFRIGGDFEMWLRLFDPQAGLRWRYTGEKMAVMSPGGISQLLVNQISVTPLEKQRALRMHGRNGNMLRLIVRLLYM